MNPEAQNYCFISVGEVELYTTIKLIEGLGAIDEEGIPISRDNDTKITEFTYPTEDIGEIRKMISSLVKDGATLSRENHSKYSEQAV